MINYVYFSTDSSFKTDDEILLVLIKQCLINKARITMNMNFSFEINDNVVVFTLKNTKLDLEIAAQLKAKLLILCQPDVSTLIFDLRNIEYVDSSGLGALLLAYRQMKENGAPIVLVGVQPMVKKMLTISQIDSLFQYEDSVESAIQEHSNKLT